MADFTTDFRASSAPLYCTIDPFDFITVFAPRVTDNTPPVLTVISPPASTVVSNLAPLVFTLSDDSGFSLRDLWVGFGVSPLAYELAFDGDVGGFRGAYAAGSSVAGTLFTLVRTGGFPVLNQVRLRANVVDTGGNVVVISA